jgi:hypothetical protein
MRSDFCEGKLVNDCWAKRELKQCRSSFITARSSKKILVEEIKSKKEKCKYNNENPNFQPDQSIKKV